MRRIWAICWNELLQVFKKPGNYAMMFALPLIFTFVAGSLMSDPETSKTKLAIVDQDHTVVSQDVVKRLTNNDILVIQNTDTSHAGDLLQNKKISGVVTIPQGFAEQLKDGKQKDIEFRHGPDLAVAPAIKKTINNALAQATVNVKAATTWSHYKGVANWEDMYKQLASDFESKASSMETKVLTRDNSTKKLNNVSYRSVGFAVMFLFMSLLIVTGTILQARASGVWYRLLSTPTSRFQIMLGYMLSFFITGWIQFGILMITTSLLFDVDWGNIPALIVLVSALNLCVVGLGMFVAGLVRTTEQQAALGSLVVVATSMLGGLYWPLDLAPDLMKKIAEFAPQTWAMRGFTDLVARGGTLTDIWGPVGVLCGFAAVFLLAGVTRVKYE